MGNRHSVNQDKFFKHIISGKVDKVRKLLEVIDPSIYNGTALTTACQMGHLDIVELLLQDSRVDPSVNDNTAIIWACRAVNKPNQIEIIKALLRSSRINPTRAAIEANQFANREIYNLLIEHPNTDRSRMQRYPEWALL